MNKIKKTTFADRIRNAWRAFCGKPAGSISFVLEIKKCYECEHRKQSEGEWVPSDIPQEKYVCSVCGGACWYYDFQGDVAKSRYCPNCGARMSGGQT